MHMPSLRLMAILMIDWMLPLDIVSLNTKSHWSKDYARNRSNRRLIEYKWNIEQPNILPPCVVRLERHYSTPKRQKRLDDDNYIGSLAIKGIRDSIAGILVPKLAPGRADHAKYGIKFYYAQTPTKSDGMIRIIIATENEYQELIERESLIELGYIPKD